MNKDKDYLKKFESTLKQLLPKKDAAKNKLLLDAVSYTLFSGGKRVRPLLALTTTHLYTKKWENALVPACALELLHTYSLIHDDLPCMDNDDFRRGKASLHKVVGEGQALLTGDLLLTLSFEVLSQAPGLTDKQKIDLIKTLSSYAGIYGMIGGQSHDLLAMNTKKKPTYAELSFIHRGKTAALMTAALVFGAVCGGAPKEDRALLTSIGNDLGLSFQIIDDWLDRNKKENLSFMRLGEKRALALSEQLFAKVCRSIHRLTIPADPLLNLAHILMNRRD